MHQLTHYVVAAQQTRLLPLGNGQRMKFELDFERKRETIHLKFTLN